jgi:hypothetical protein
MPIAVAAPEMIRALPCPVAALVAIRLDSRAMIAIKGRLDHLYGRHALNVAR